MMNENQCLHFDAEFIVTIQHLQRLDGRVDRLPTANKDPVDIKGKSILVCDRGGHGSNHGRARRGGLFGGRFIEMRLGQLDGLSRFESFALCHQMPGGHDHSWTTKEVCSRGLHA